VLDRVEGDFKIANKGEIGANPLNLNEPSILRRIIAYT